jgi:hypothetical protein
VGPQPPPQAPQQPAAPQALSLTELYSPPATGPAEDLLTAFSAHGAAPLGNKELVFKRFLTNNTGVAYEDSLVQVNLAIQSNGPNALLTFIVTNKTSQSLTNVKLHVMPVPFFRANSKPGPQNLGPQGMATHQFAFTVLSPFSDPPEYIFSYNDVRERAKLPLVITKFMGQFPMNHTVFFQRWAQFSAANQIAKATYPVVPAVEPNQQMASLMLGLLKINVLPLELPPFNVCGAGVVSCESGAQGLLTRFFASPETRMVQIEVRGTSPQIASAIQKVLDLQFK